MQEVAKKYQDEAPRINKNIKNSVNYEKDNLQRYNEMRRFTFHTSLTGSDKATLDIVSKPQIEFNICELFISRLVGEFYTIQPDVCVGWDEDQAGMPPNQQLIDVVEGHFRHLLDAMKKDDTQVNTYRDSLMGLGVMEIGTEYEGPRSFKQKIKVKWVRDPTMVGFDPMAEDETMCDGDFCFQMIPFRQKEAMSKFDLTEAEVKYAMSGFEGFSWISNGMDEKIVIICKYFEKKKKKIKICQLANGKIINKEDYNDYLEQYNAEGHIAQPAEIVQERMTEITTISRYYLMGSKVLEYVETDFSYLPFIKFPGNTVALKETDNDHSKNMLRPYMYHLAGIQKLKNFAGQTLANELENLVMHKFIVAKEGIPAEYQNAYANYQVPSTLIYNSYDKENPEVPIPAPREVQRTPIPPEVMGTFSAMDQAAQMTLGSFDASLGINDNQLSGVAIIEGATQSNAAAKPYVIKYMRSLNQVLIGGLDILGKYFKKGMSIPILDEEGEQKLAKINQEGAPSLIENMDALHIRLDAGPSFQIQKTKALNQINAQSQASPMFAQFINEKCLPIILDNMEIRGIDRMKELGKEFMQEQAQAKQKAMSQPNPEQMKLQIMQGTLQHKQMQTQADMQQHQGDMQVDLLDARNDAAKILSDKEVANKQIALEKDRLKLDTMNKGVEHTLKAHEMKVGAHDMLREHRRSDIETVANLTRPQESE